MNKPISELHTGRAGEYLAAADLLLKGFDCFHSAQGMPYDLVVDTPGRLLRVQVKATLTTRAIPQRKVHVPAYIFWINRCGKGGGKGYSEADVDLFALVALDTKEVGYIAAGYMPRTLCVRTEKNRGKYFDEIKGSRNNAVRADIAAGMSIKDARNKYGMDKAYVHRLKNSPEYENSAGVYLSDLSLLKAIGGIK